MKILRKLFILIIAVNTVAALMGVVFAEVPGSESGADEKVIVEEGNSSQNEYSEDIKLKETNPAIKSQENEQEEFESKKEEPDIQKQQSEAIDVNKNGWKYELGCWFYYKHGVKISSWLKYNGKLYYLDKDNPDYPNAMLSNSKKVISNATYFFDESGVMRTGWISEPEGWYYADSSSAIGWKQSGDRWYYLDSENKQYPGLMLKDTWKSIDGDVYYFDSSGAMKTGWHYKGGDWYYLNSNGTMATGWKRYQGAWYYLDGNDSVHTGAMLSNEKKVIGNATYLFDGSGAMRTGWISESEGWYYADAASSIGWKKYGDEWYYLDSDNKSYPGLMIHSGWKQIDGGRYCFDSSGAMKTGWHYEDGDWYYLNPSGDMATGWKNVDRYWYYMYPDGKMAKNTVIDGYTVGMSGAWQQYPYDDYIIVNISTQTLIYYKNHQRILESDVVTGINDSTPRGIFTIGSKSANIYLIGPGYKSFVSYWMSFIGAEYGLHDASWRNTFGGSIYKYNGSHGCINLPFSTAKHLFNNVILHRTKLIVE